MGRAHSLPVAIKGLVWGRGRPGGLGPHFGPKSGDPARSPKCPFSWAIAQGIFLGPRPECRKMGRVIPRWTRLGPSSWAQPSGPPSAPYEALNRDRKRMGPRLGPLAGGPGVALAGGPPNLTPRTPGPPFRP